MTPDEAPNLDHLGSIHLDGSRKHPVTADVRGRFIRARRAVFVLLIGFYAALPFWKVGGRPAVQIDIVGRRFFLFGSVFNAQDGFRLVFLVLTAGFALMLVTALFGRIWCGWGCPQTVFLEAVFRPIERFFEGSREARLKADRTGMTPARLVRRLLKHASYVVVSLLLAHVFLALFVPLPELFSMMAQDPRAHWTAFVRVMAITGLVYFNWAWFREQFCVVLCPYGRLQSALLDDESVIIGYDTGRGEPRGRRVRESVSLPVVDGAAGKRGDCVDCGRCVVVCPTGIDIRQGSQLDCIGCAQCVDACDEVMGKIQRPRGLIRYDSLRGLTGRTGRLLRPRMMLYAALLTVASSALAFATIGRSHFEANLLRVRGAPYVLEADALRNAFELHLVNKNPGPTTLHVEASGRPDVRLTLPMQDVRLEPLADFRLPVMVAVPRAAWQGTFELTLTVSDEASGQTRAIAARVLGPHGKAPEGPATFP